MGHDKNINNITIQYKNNKALLYKNLYYILEYMHVLGLSDLCLGVQKKIFKEIMHFHYKTYMAMP